MLQRALGVTADGILGPQTRAALRRFERNHGRPADGQPDRATLRALGIKLSRTTSGSGGTQAPAAPTPGTPADVAVEAAQSKIGSSYSHGASGPATFDCSGLTSWAFERAGVSLPHSSFTQYDKGVPVQRDRLQPGDLVFFDTAGPGASDVGIAVSTTTAVSATTHGVVVHSILSGYWGNHYVGARRIT